MGRYKTLLTNTGLMFLGQFGSRIISFVMLPFYTMWLSVEDYGTSDMIAVYATIISTIVSLGIAEAIFVIPAQKNKDEQTSYFSSSLAFSIICVIVLLLMYFCISILFPSSKGVFFNHILYICIITVLSIYRNIFQQFCKSINKIKVFAIAGVIQTLAVAGLGFFLIPTYKLDGFIWSLILSNLITIIYLFLFARLVEYITVSSFSSDCLKEMLKYSVPLIPNSIVWLIVSYLNRPIMETSLGLYALGIFSLANRFPTLINTVYNTFSNSWQISILEQYGKDGFSSFYNKVTLISFCMVSVLIAMLALLAKPIVYMFLNSNYYESVSYIPLLCLSCLFVSLGSMVGAIFSAVRESKYYFYSSVWSAVSAIVLNFIFIKLFGLYGACWACVISYLIGGVTRIIYAKRFNTFDYPLQIAVVSVLTVCVVCVMSYTGNYMFGILSFLLLMGYIGYLLMRTNVLAMIVEKISRK